MSIRVWGNAAAAEPLGILGGTFDPVHNGHLRAGLEVLEACRLSAMRLIPAGFPAHRERPAAPADLRLRMLRAAAAGEPRFAVDEREIRRTGPSYMVDTLASLRAEAPNQPLCLVLGADAFLGLTAWHRWRDLFDLAHVIVVHRPGWAVAAEADLGAELAARRSAEPEALHRTLAGVIRVQPITRLEISSSAIRALVASGGDPRFLVPDPVRDLIMMSRCYHRPAGVIAGPAEV